MIILKKGLAALAVTLALSALASPSYAQGRGVEITPKRAQACCEALPRSLADRKRQNSTNPGNPD